MLCGFASVVVSVIGLRSIEVQSRNLRGDYINRYLQGENLYLIISYMPWNKLNKLVVRFVQSVDLNKIKK